MESTTREVWQDNLECELNCMSRMAATHGDYISIDTEFPGFLYNTPRHVSVTQRYGDMKRNVDALKIVQLGLTFYNKAGESLGFSWQINFKEFNPSVDLHGTDAVEFLSRSGIDLEKNQICGVDATSFSKQLQEKLITPCCGKTNWITFHGIYDLGYLVKLLTGLPLPNTFLEFSFLVEELLGYVYDIKHIMKFYGFDSRIGLVRLAKELGVYWEGQAHQAGYDSMITGSSFWKIKKSYDLHEDYYEGILYGFERVCPPPCWKRSYKTTPIATGWDD